MLIELTKYPQRGAIIINPAYVTSVDMYDGGQRASVHLEDRPNIIVEESYETVRKRLGVKRPAEIQAELEAMWAQVQGNIEATDRVLEAMRSPCS